MKSIVLFLGLAAVVASQAPSMPGGGGGMMQGSGMNFNLSTPQGIMGFLQMENIDPSSLVTSNCIANGNSCTPGGGKPCCLSPVFTCMGMAGGSGNQCMVVNGHTNHLAEIRQIVQTAGVTTMNPIL